MRKRGFFFPFTLVLSSMLAACQVESSQVKTDLGKSNIEVGKRINRNLASARLCNTQMNNASRAIVTGFGPFDGPNSQNISGILVNSMASPNFWPAQIQLDNAAKGTAAVVRNRADGSDVTGSVRTLKINERSYEVCFLELSVRWDVASAIVLEEAEHFKAKLIVLTGSGREAITFEWGAVNDALDMSDFDSKGQQTGVLPVRGSKILPTGTAGLKDPIPMTWNGEELARVTRRFAPRGIDVEAKRVADSNNNYVCNNSSYIILSGLAGIPLTLAGNEVKLKYTPRGVKAGFLHIADQVPIDAESIFSLGKMIAATIESELSRSSP